MVAPERHVLFEYTRDHTNDAVDSVLACHEGYLVADAHVVYDHLYAGGHFTEVNCWAHARRYFFKAVGTDPERAKGSRPTNPSQTSVAASARRRRRGRE
jgi:hypothetical protein